MEYHNDAALVSCEWLEAHLDDANVKIIDATYHLPHDERDAAEEFGFRHIPGAHFFNIDVVADTSVDLPHMLPDAATFQDAVEGMGISDGDHVVVYDSNGGYMAACRVWWMFRCFGYDNVSVLNGGLVRWGKERRTLEHEEREVERGHFTPKLRPELVKSKADMLANIESGASQVVDARNEGRFKGVDHEPRPTERRGHIPGSINVPFTLITPPPKDFTFKNSNEIADVLDGAGVDMDKPAIVTCGSGVTACVVAFAMHLLGHEDAAIYDGSWAEWGNDANVPINA